MRTSAPSLVPLLRSELQAEMLALLLLPPHRPWTARELRERLHTPGASLHRELQRALSCGVVEREAIGRTYRYRAAPGSPLLEPLEMLLDRTLGVESRLRDALEELPGVDAAVIHGSWAAGRIDPTSDVDVLVVGDPDPVELTKRMRRIEDATGRAIDYVLLGPDEFRRKLADGNPFVRKIVANPVKPVTGELPDSTG